MMKDLKKEYSFISKLGLDFQDYEKLTKADMDMIQKWHDVFENVKKRIEWRERNLKTAEKEIGGFITQDDMEDMFEKLDQDRLLLETDK